MHVLVGTLNYHTAPVHIRERVSFSEAELSDAMKILSQEKSIFENVIVSTCNRTEIYAVVDQYHTSRYYIKRFLSLWFHLSMEELSEHLHFYEGDDAIAHLFKVTSGLDSMVIGETQILGQVKQSFLQSQHLQTTGAIFNMLFKQAVTFAKRIHSETEIGEKAVSVSYAAVELVKKKFKDLSSKHVLIIGAGTMSELALQNLQGCGVASITVINRTYDHALTMAGKYDGCALPYTQLDEGLVKADIVITSTGARHSIITSTLMKRVMRQRKSASVLIDIAVPRDIEEDVKEVENVIVYNIDDLESVVQSNLHERMLLATKINLQIQDEVAIFKKWISTLGVVPIISALRDKGIQIQDSTFQSLERKLPNLSEREYVVIRKHFKSIINQLLKDPILKVKELSNEEQSAEQLQLFIDIFNLESQLQSLEKEEIKG